MTFHLILSVVLALALLVMISIAFINVDLFVSLMTRLLVPILIVGTFGVVIRILFRGK